jgi:fatty acid desaturase
LNVKAVLKSLLGIRAIEALLLYLKGTKQRAAGMTRGAQTTRALAIAPASRAVILGAAVHCLILGGLWLSGWSAAALAWILGVGGVMPLLNTIRQVLEHRTMDARAEIDYARTNQGACARIFGTGLFASTFGSAGANRHLLHHWEPEISYTRLAELERFLADTPMHVVMEKRRTTYYAAFRSLLSR